MRIGLERDKCQGYGQCSIIDPDLFPLDDDGYSALGESKDVPAGEEDNAQLGVDSCPVQALRVL